MAGATVVFFHAHPDDEAIFTGGTMRRLADRGDRVVLVVATRGELGLDDGDRPLPDRREAETLAACAELGVAAVHFLGYADSGLDADASGGPTGAFARADVDEAAGRLATVLVDERADAVVTYDERGIYGHPDHVQVHRVAVAAQALAGVAVRYESTVDREYLHFVETHLVEEAGQAMAVPVGPLDDTEAPWAPTLHAADVGGADHGLGLAATAVGMPTILIDATVDVRGVIAAKRAAMLAHASQIPPSSSAVQLAEPAFAEVYGYEWYLRAGPAGPLDALGSL